MSVDLREDPSVRIFMDDDCEVTCRLVGFWFEDCPGFELTGFSHHRDTALAPLCEIGPDSVLLDASAHEHEPLRPTDVRAAVPGVALIVYSGHPPEFARKIAPGADAYVRKAGEPDELIAALRRLAAAVPAAIG